VITGADLGSRWNGWTLTGQLSIMNMHQQGGVADGSVKLCAGIDVSKLHLDVCVGATWQRVLNDANGWNELTAMLQAARVWFVSGS
jgi:hypothetical protein